MRRRWRRLRWLLGSWPGRLEIRRRQTRRLWLPVALLARAQRLTLARRVHVVAIVGSVGKTTTMRATSAVLGVPVTTGALLNANSYASVAGGIARLRPWQHHAVVEVGLGGPGEMARHAGYVRPNVVVVTAVASDHWRSFGTLEATRDEKQLMVAALPAGGTAVLNADDELVRTMAQVSRAPVVLFGTAADADVRASEVRLEWPPATRFTLHAAGEQRDVRVKLLGRPMLMAGLAAIAVGLAEGVALDAAIAAVGGLEPTPSRMQPLALASGAFVVLDDFKATPESFETALTTLADLPARRRIVLIGAINEAPQSEYATYRAVGRRIGEVADQAIFVGAKHGRYRPGALAAGMRPDQIMRVESAQAATALLRDQLGDGDVVLVKGRWQHGLARFGLALAGRDVRCRAEPCPFRRMVCVLCPMLERPFEGRPAG